MSVLCALSGEAPEQPVLSRKSGHVYEKRLIEAYVSENATEPTTGETLAIEDLIPINTARTVRPRPPTLTSIPSLLGVFQQEWDALVLEVFNLQQNLEQTRQELSTALYEQDAAVRVIARLTRERDEARKALSEVNVGGKAATFPATNGESMQVDSTPLPESVISTIEGTQAALMKTRRKRPVPAEWATPDAISSYKPRFTSESVFPGATFLDISKTGDLALVGGSDGAASVCSASDGQLITSIRPNTGSITAGCWVGSHAVLGSADGTVRLFSKDKEQASFRSHKGPVTSLSVHPSGTIFASVSEDRSYVLYDAEAPLALTQVYTDSALSCAQFHPDGHLLAAGSAAGQIKIFDVKSGVLAGSFEAGSPVTALCFSENGTWLAAATAESSIIGVWDLRKTGSEGLVNQLETSGAVSTLDWDYTAQFLMSSGSNGITVHQYTKSTKEWSEPFKASSSTVAAVWGQNAKSILALDGNGLLTILS